MVTDDLKELKNKTARIVIPEQTVITNMVKQNQLIYFLIINLN